MSLLNTSKPGLLPRVVWTPVLFTWEAMDNALFIRSFAAITVIGGSSSNKVHRMLPTVWCILSHTEFAVGLQLVVETSLMLHLASNSWNSHPMNSPPLSWMHLVDKIPLAN